MKALVFVVALAGCWGNRVATETRPPDAGSTSTRHPSNTALLARARQLVDAQRHAALAKDGAEDAFHATLSADCLVLGNNNNVESIREFVDTYLALNPHEVVVSNAIENFAAGGSDEAIWVAFTSVTEIESYEIETRRERRKVEITEVFTKAAGWKAVAFAASFGFRGGRPGRPLEPMTRTTTAGRLSQLLTSPPQIASALTSDGVAITLDARVSGEHARTILKTMPELVLAGDPRGLTRDTWGFVQAHLDLMTPRGVVHLRAQLIAVRDRDRWSVAAVHYVVP